MKRKTIAVCVTGYNWEYESRVVDGIYQNCQEQDINMLVFASLMKRPEWNSGRVLPESIMRGETEVFRLINYDLIDGIVILGDSLIEESVIYDIAAKAKERRIPVININDPEHSLYRNIILSDKIAMEFVMRHLIEDHGLTKINFIGGFPGNLQTEERLAAYKKILQEHNIPVEEERIAYGEFWKKATDCTEKFLEAEELPQAIVCASDTMAFFCMDCLKNHGYRIPDDIIVTGFDGIKDCEEYSPTLTTVRRDFWGAGHKAVEILGDIWADKETPEICYINSTLIKNQSCGCEPMIGQDEVEEYSFYRQHYSVRDRFIEFNTYILEMNSNFASATNSVELYQDTLRGAKFFNLNKCFLCICEEAENGSGDLEQEELSAGMDGTEKTMISKIQYGHDVPIGTKFSAKDLVPESFLDGDKPVFYAFSPIYFKNRYLGYLAYEPTVTHGDAGDLFATWVLLISNNAGSFYMKNELEYVVDKLEALYIRDPLTNLYNRRGMAKMSAKLVECAKEKREMVTVLCADVDNLKPVNDLYGHEAGDNIILQTAIALSTAMPAGSVCVRTGGDEFCVILSHEQDVMIESYIQQVDKILADYNATSNLPYNVGCSCGYHSAWVEEVEALDDVVKIADENMYKVKNIKKTIRK